MQDKYAGERSIYERSVDLAAYLPPFMAEYREMQAVMGAENTVFAELLENLKKMLDDLFIQTASETALARYERIMGRDAAANESADTRRLRLLLSCARAQKCTIPSLIAAAAVLGEMVEVHILPGHMIQLDFLSGNEENIAVLQREFEASLPAHMEIEVRNVQKFRGEGVAGGTAGMSMHYCFKEV